MINIEQLLSIWRNAVDIIPDEGDDSVFLGFLENITDAPAGVNAVMEFWTHEVIDPLLVEGEMSDTQKLELLTLRGFTFQEYATLFDTIKESEYTRYPAYQSLLITEHGEKAAIIYQLTPDKYDDYLALLKRTLQLFNQMLYSFLYVTYSTRTN